MMAGQFKWSGWGGGFAPAPRITHNPAPRQSFFARPAPPSFRASSPAQTVNRQGGEQRKREEAIRRQTWGQRQQEKRLNEQFRQFGAGMSRALDQRRSDPAYRQWLLHNQSRAEREFRMARAELNNPILRNINRKRQHQPGMFDGLRPKDADKFFNTWIPQWGRDKRQDAEALRMSGWWGGDNGKENQYTDAQLQAIYNRIPFNYRPPLDPFHQFPDDFQIGILSGRDRFLQDLFVKSAQQTNIKGFTGMSNEAMAAFMLSQVKLERENWDKDTNTIYNPPPNLAGFLAQTYSSIFSRAPGFLQALNRNSEGGRRNAGVSYGVPNLYLLQSEEAWAFHRNLEENLAGYDVERVLDMDSLGSGRGFFHSEPLALNEDPFYAIRSLGLVLNWAGARQLINIGAGDTNFPAIRPENYGVDGQTRSIQDVSAFSLVVTRYSDATDAAGFQTIIGSPEFPKMVNAVEGTDEAATELGYKWGTDIVVGRDFIPYTGDQPSQIVDALINRAVANDRDSLEALCKGTMLQAAYNSISETDTVASRMEKAGLRCGS